MQYILEISFISFLVFLFCIFKFAKDDFILLRKNITLEQLFNVSFIIYILGFLFARIVYVLEHLSNRFLDPFVFFLFTYFPGLSISGGLLISVGFLFYVMNSRSLPFQRVFDIFSLSFLFAWFSGLPFYAIISFLMTKKFPFVVLLGSVVFLFLAIGMTVFFIKNKLKDGSIGYISIGFFSFFYIFFQAFLRGRNNFFHFVPEDLVLLFIGFFSLAMFAYQEVTILLAKGRK